MCSNYGSCSTYQSCQALEVESLRLERTCGNYLSFGRQPVQTSVYKLQTSLNFLKHVPCFRRVNDCGGWDHHVTPAFRTAGFCFVAAHHDALGCFIMLVLRLAAVTLVIYFVAESRHIYGPLKNSTEETRTIPKVYAVVVFEQDDGKSRVSMFQSN